MATVIKGTRLSETVYCHRLTEGVGHLQPVMECNAYEDSRKASLYEMHQIAWKVCTDKRGKRIGLLSPDEMNRRKGEVVVAGSGTDDF
jgi:hypothetical protein